MLVGSYNFVLVAAVIYLVVIFAVSRSIEGSRHAMDRLVTGVVTTTFLLAMVPLVSVLWTILSKGFARFDTAFFTYSMQGVGSGEVGGAYHAIIGTVSITFWATLMSVPVGLLTAIYLVEYGKGSRLARITTFLIDVMTGIPSIVAGLFAISLVGAIALYHLVEEPARIWMRRMVGRKKPAVSVHAVDSETRLSA